MEERIIELEKTVEKLESYVMYCTEALQTMAYMLDSLADNERLYESEVNKLHDFIKKNL